MQCNKCGSINEEGSEVCQNCGAYLIPKSDMQTTIVLSPTDAEQEYGKIELNESEGRLLIVKKGPSVGQKFILGKSEITLGRDPGNDIFLDDITVSRHHAKIIVNGNSVGIMDVGSLNGTYVNQERIEGITALKSNDELQIGKFKLVFLSKK
ncbi:MAG: FHA domain-containing protein [Actinomycetota bacterium]|nr:FHA domain-containing protein [Actinomycetota bacterium]